MRGPYKRKLEIIVERDKKDSFLDIELVRVLEFDLFFSGYTLPFIN